jgi:phosphoribosylformylglycinamidine synthase
VPKDPPAWVLEELKKPRDYAADLKKLLASANICSKRWIYEQYDSMVQTNTVQGPGGEAGVMRIKGTGKQGLGTRDEGRNGFNDLGSSVPSASSLVPEAPERGLAMALAGNGRWCYLDPKLGAMHAVAEAARKVACTGATPVAATNCLNFGNPQKPEIMAQLSQAIDGIAEACNALGTPVTGGNVSLYNETLGEGIYPTPVIGIVGILDDVTKAVPSGFQQEGDAVIQLFAQANSVDSLDLDRSLNSNFGSTDFAKSIFGTLWGSPDLYLDLGEEAKLHKFLAELATAKLIHSASDISDGGFAVAIAKSSFAHGIGCRLPLPKSNDETDHLASIRTLFSEDGGCVIVTASKEKVDHILELADSMGIGTDVLGETIAGRIEISNRGDVLVEASVEELQVAYAGSLESALAEEVLA